MHLSSFAQNVPKRSIYTCGKNDVILPFSPPYRQNWEIQNEDEKTILKELEILKATLEASVEFSKCPHQESMFDEGTGICMSCGAYTGVCFAPLSANTSGVQGAHHHAFSSNVSSSIARKKRTAAILANTIDFDVLCKQVVGKNSASSSSSSISGEEDIINKINEETGVVVVVKTLSTTTTTKTSSSLPSSNKKQREIKIRKPRTKKDSVVEKTEIREKTSSEDDGTSSTSTKRSGIVSSFKEVNTLMVKTFVSSVYSPKHQPPSSRGCSGNGEMKKMLNSNYIKLLLSEAFGLESGHKMLIIGRCKKACEKYIDYSEENIDNLNCKIIDEVQNIVIKYFPKYFSSQRRKIHVFLYVAAILAHSIIVHSSSQTNTKPLECTSSPPFTKEIVDFDSCSECLDITRLKTKMKATSLSLSSSSSYILIGARLGIDTKCAGRLVQDAFSLIFEGDSVEDNATLQ